MAADLTVSNYLLPMIRRRASLPTSAALLSDADILALANDELFATIVPAIREANEEYFVKYFDQAVVSGQAEYQIPAWATSGSLRNVEYVDTQGARYPLTRLSPDQLGGLPTAPLSLGNMGGYGGFYIRDNAVALWPIPNNPPAATLRISAFRRPNDLVINSAATQVTAIAVAGATTLTVSTNPGTMSTATNLDIIGGTSPFVTRVDTALPNSVGAGNIVFANSVTGISSVVVGDWVALTTESPLAQVVREALPVLAQATTVKCLEALGDKQGLSLAQGKFAEMRQAMVNELSPRVAGAPQKIVNPRSVFGRFPFGTRRFY